MSALVELIPELEVGPLTADIRPNLDALYAP
jgi:hypothetical protein